MRRSRLTPDAVAASIGGIGKGTALLLALATLAAGALARLALAPLLGESATFIFFVPAVVVAAALAGLWPGLLLTLLGAVAGLALEASSGGITIGETIAAAVFLLVG